MSDLVKKYRRRVNRGKDTTTLAQFQNQQALESVAAAFDQERTVYQTQIRKLKEEIRSLYQQQQGAVSAVAAATAASNASVASVQTDVDRKVKALESKLQDLSLSIQSSETKLATEMAKVMKRDETESLLQRMEKPTRLHVGAPCNLPEQPEPVQEGGAYKVPPLALSVNGSIAAHNIGYTSDRKNLIPLYYDAATERLVAFVPNK